MKKFLLVILLGFLFIGGFLVSLPFWYDLHRLQKPVLTLIEKPLGVDIELGKITVKWSRHFVVSLHRFSLASKKSESKEPFLQTEKLTWEMDLKNLARRIIAGKLTLEKPVIRWPGETNLPGLHFSRWYKYILIEQLILQDGSLSYERDGGPLQVTQLEVKLTNLTLRRSRAPLSFDISGRGGDGTVFTGEGRTEYDPTEQKVTLLPSSFKIGAGELKLEGSWSHGVTTLNGHLQMKDSHVTYQDLFAKPAGSPFEVTFEGSHAVGECKISKLDVTLGSLSLKGEGHKSPAQPLELTLTTGPADLRSFSVLMPRWQDTRWTGIINLKVDLSLQKPGQIAPGEWEANTTLTSDQLSYDTKSFSKVTALLHLKPGQLTLKSFDGDLPKGHFSGSGDIEFANNAWDLEATWREIDLAATTTQWGGFTPTVSGTGTLTFRGKGVGITAAEIRPTLSGEGKLSITEGEWHLENFVKNIFATPVTQLLQLAPPLFLQQTKPIPLKMLEIPFTVTQGQIQITTPPLGDENQSVNLSGWVNLDGQVNMAGQYFLNPIKVESWITNPKLRSAVVESDGRLKLPFSLAGTLPEPTINLDLTGLKSSVDKAITEMILPTILPTTLPTNPVDNIDRDIEKLPKKTRSHRN